MIDQLDQFFRVHSRLYDKPFAQTRKKGNSYVPKLTPGLLLFDCATTKDGRLSFGASMQLRLKDGRYEPVRKGCNLFYAEGIANRGKTTLRQFAQNKIYKVVSADDFRRNIFLPLLAKGVLVAGWDMPFQLSRIALKINRAKKNRRAFAMYFAVRPDGRPSGCWPGVQVENLGAGQSLYRNLKVFMKDKKWQREQNSRQVRPFDLQSLCLTLTGEVLGLNDAREALGLSPLPEYTMTGRLTKPDIEHMVLRLEMMREVMNVMLTEYQRHPVSLRPEHAISPASLFAKSYYKEAGLHPPFVSDVDHGIAMQALAAGRAECGLRRTPVPISYVDFHSQFGAMSSLLKIHELISADRLELARWTNEARELMESLTNNEENTLKRCLERDFWPLLRVFCKVEPGPEGCLIPVRGRYSTRHDADPTVAWQTTIGARQPYWTTLMDVIAAALAGRAPRIINAVRVMPKGKQAVTPVKIYGEISFNPLTDELPEKLLELKNRLKLRDPFLAAGIKVGINSAASGIWCEQDLTDLVDKNGNLEPQYLEIFSGSTRFRTEKKEEIWEKPGSMYCPIISALVFGGSHLLLAMLQRMIHDAGGSGWLFCDTDGAAIISNEAGTPVKSPDGVSKEIPTVSWKQVEEIRLRFESLNPRKGTDFLKLEPENFGEDGKTRIQLYGYSVAAKRHALFNLINGDVVIRRPSGHALAIWQPPYDVRKWERKYRRKWQGTLPPWVWESWRYLIRRELGVPTRTPSWMNVPAAMPFPISTPPQWEKIGLLPFTNVLMVSTRAEKRFDGAAGKYVDCPVSRGQWIAPHTDDPNSLYGARIVSLKDGSEAWLSRPDSPRSRSEIAAKTLGAYVEEHLEMPESKFLMPSGGPCRPGGRGLLRRRTVFLSQQRFIGKETSHRWTYGNSPDMIAGNESLGEQTCREFKAAASEQKCDATIGQGRRGRNIPVKQLARLAGVSERSVERFRADKPLRRSTLGKINRALIDLEIPNEAPLVGTPQDLRLRGKVGLDETANALNKLAEKIRAREQTPPVPETLNGIFPESEIVE